MNRPIAQDPSGLTGGLPVSAPARVVLAGMPQMYRDALIRFIHATDGFAVVADGKTGREALNLCLLHSPDILVIAIELEDGDGIEVCREILRAKPATKVIFLRNARGGGEPVLRGIRSGGLGFVLICEPASRLIEALQAVAQGRAYVPASTWDAVLARLQNLPHQTEPGGLRALSPRQTRILAMIIEGKTTRQMASILGVGMSTIGTARRILLRQMNVKTTPELISAALAQGFKPTSETK